MVKRAINEKAGQIMTGLLYFRKQSPEPGVDRV